VPEEMPPNRIPTPPFSSGAKAKPASPRAPGGAVQLEPGHWVQLPSYDQVSATGAEDWIPPKRIERPAFRSKISELLVRAAGPVAMERARNTEYVSSAASSAERDWEGVSDF
jgi:hypothetical protein